MPWKHPSIKIAMRFQDELRGELAALEEQGRRRTLRKLAGSPGRIISIDGREVLNFSSNNYLGLADHPCLIRASVEAAQRHGIGTTGSRLVVGNHNIHEELEKELARFHQVPRVLLFNSGYSANIGILPAIARADDVIFSDSLNHASIIDGCRLSRARVVIYPHADVHALRLLMERHTGSRRVVVTESVFSMDGDRAPIKELDLLCEETHSLLVVDEAHATGILGPGGRGVAAEVGVEPDVHIGTLSKGLGGFGGYLAGREELVEVVLNRARSFIFTTALPLSVAAVAREALTLVQGIEGENRRQSLAQRIEQFRLGLSELGLLSCNAGTTPIFPVLVGDERQVMECSERLLSAGIYVQGIRPPTVPVGTARLRLTMMALHTQDDCAQVLSELSNLMDTGLIQRKAHGDESTEAGLDRFR